MGRDLELVATNFRLSGDKTREKEALIVRKFIALCLALVLTLSIVGCSNRSMDSIIENQHFGLTPFSPPDLNATLSNKKVWSRFTYLY